MPYVSNYTFQFWHKSNQRINLTFSCSSTYDTFETLRTWQHYVIVFTAAELSDIRITLPAGEYWFYNTKAEKGTIATDWSPYPEDVLKNLDGTFTQINQVLARYEGSISNVESKVDKVDKSITDKIWQTDFETEINGVYRDLEKINDGNNKWFLTVYEKSNFPTGEQSSVQEPEENEEEQEESSEYDPVIDPIILPDDPQDETNYREKYDITVLSSNLGVNPSIEVMVPDTQVGMMSSVPSDGRIFYYMTFARFSEDTVIPLRFTHGKTTIYINGVQHFTSAELTTDTVSLSFNKGWNLIEIISNNTGVSFSSNISENENCTNFNCMIAIPTSMSVKTREQYSYLNRYIDNTC